MRGAAASRDPAAAAVWFEKAAAQNLAQAQFRLGAIYEKGVGVPRDPNKARDYYQKAANQGHVRAMHNLAVMLAEGVEGKPDYASAAQWFRRAADYGVRDSQFNLAILYARGMGVTQNLGQSYVWFDIAARQGDEDATKKRDEIAARLDAATLDAARKQASDFRARTPAAAVNDPPAVPAGPAAAFISAPVVKAALSKF
jgi:localization factor PodJL